MLDKLRLWMYYVIIGIVSLIALLFVPMIGSSVGLGWNLPNTTVGWIVFIAVKLIIAILNVLIFHCFMQQAKLNVKDHQRYKEAKEMLSEVNKAREFVPRSPSYWNRKQYTTKGVSLFITTALSTIALTQAILTFDWVSMLTYLFTIVMGLIFGVMQMKTAEEYWTEEYYEYAKMINNENSRSKVDSLTLQVSSIDKTDADEQIITPHTDDRETVMQNEE